MEFAGNRFTGVGKPPGLPFLAGGHGENDNGG